VTPNRSTCLVLKTNTQNRVRLIFFPVQNVRCTELLTLLPENVLMFVIGLDSSVVEFEGGG
jgi:hypothetical protein